MSGHSKWATIHRQKEAKDAKKGAVFTKMAANITVAVRQGGGVSDPEQNFRLRLAIDKARESNMPKENISRAIAKGTGAGGGNDLHEATYEGFLPGGCALLVDTLSDNKARISQQIRLILEKGGGSLVNQGAVAYMFTPMGEIRIESAGEAEELTIIDMGVAEDIETESDGLTVYCQPHDTFTIKDKLENAKFRILSAGIVMRPNNYVEIREPELRTKIEHILDSIEEMDEVNKVWTNYA